MKLFKRLSLYLQPYLGRLVVAAVCMGMVAALNALRIYLVKPLQDKVFIGHDMGVLMQLIWAVPVISLLLGLFSYVQNYLMASIGLRATNDIREKMFDHVQGLSLD